jgi:hypothetical protein
VDDRHDDNFADVEAVVNGERQAAEDAFAHVGHRALLRLPACLPSSLGSPPRLVVPLLTERAGSPRFLGKPPAPMPRSWTPAGPSRLAFFGASVLSPFLCQLRGLQQLGLSGLGSAALVLAVYASQLGLLRLHARLASGWWLAFAGRALTREVPFDRFPLITYMAFSFPRLFLARWHLSSRRTSPRGRTQGVKRRIL